MKFGVEKLMASDELKNKIAGERIGLLCHGASVDQDLNHSLDLMMADSDINVTCAFGPQHGFRAERQDNMVESSDYIHATYNIPIYSLYGEFRRPQQNMLENIDILIVDLQDVGCRIYTFLTTLFYCLEACDEFRKKIIVLDRPNPAGRPVEGLTLDMSFQSFVGAAPLPMRHGLTLGEAALWYKSFKKLDVDLEIISMDNYEIDKGWKYWWPQDRSWVNPSPNMPRVTCTQVYCGTVLLEGTLTSEGRGTTLPLEMFGAPSFDGLDILNRMREINKESLHGVVIRPCFFEPTFHKHCGQVCGGMQLHVDHPRYNEFEFRPYRLINVYLKAVKTLYPQFDLWRRPPYEYEEKMMPIDILSGDSQLRNWVDSNSVDFSVLEKKYSEQEAKWSEERRDYLLY